MRNLKGGLNASGCEIICKFLLLEVLLASMGGVCDGDLPLGPHHLLLPLLLHLLRAVQGGQDGQNENICIENNLKVSDFQKEVENIL